MRRNLVESGAHLENVGSALPLQAAGVSVIIPAYNEEAMVGKVVEAVLRQSERIGQAIEVVVVDDGSLDNTAACAQRAGATVVRHRWQKGYGAAIKTGIRHTARPIVVLLDADGQHNPDDLPAMVEGLKEHDMCIGKRLYRDGGPMSRAPGKWLMRRFAQYLTGIEIPDLNCGFRAVRRRRMEQALHLLPDGFSLSTTLTIALLRAGSEVVWHPIKFERRTMGQSEVKPFSDGLKVLLSMGRVTMLFAPLRVFIPISAVLLLMGGVSLGLDSLVMKMSGATILLGLGGVTIFCFGMLADQLAAIRRELKL